MEKIVLGIDIGGTKVAFGFVKESGDIIFQDEIATKSISSVKSLANKLYSIAKENNLLNDLVGIGIGAPNGNHLTGTINYAPNLAWEGIIEVEKEFTEVFKLKTILHNDANAAAIGEKIFGTAKNLSDFVVITLGTGVGSGVFINNKLLLGKNGGAGEYGHIRVINEGRVCGCERKGCLETYASSTGVVRSIALLESDNKHLSAISRKENPSAFDVFEYAKNGDLFAIEIVNYTAEILGNALADFTAFSEPEAFILFGGLSKSGDYFSDLVQEHLNNNLLSIYKNSVKVINSSLNDKNAAILGASSVLFYTLNHE